MSKFQKRRRIRFKFVNGLKQDQIELDFHITPVLTFARADKRKLKGMGTAWGLCLEWGHWAFGFGTYTVYVNN